MCWVGLGCLILGCVDSSGYVLVGISIRIGIGSPGGCMYSVKVWLGLG